MAILPPELIHKILLVLPVKSLLRFRCVSKSFYAIINKDFIHSRLNASSKKRIHRKPIYQRNYLNGIEIHALDINNASLEEVLLDFELPDLFVASCNDLILLYPADNQFSIWNPSTRHYKELPDLPVSFVKSSFWKKRHSGFGYDSTTDDYKVLQILCMEESSYQVWIFQLRSGCWRRIQDFPYTKYTNLQKAKAGNCFVDGFEYTLCYREGRKSSHILAAFNVAKETFSIVPEPVYENQGMFKCF